jgi:hypothetical protein
MSTSNDSKLIEKRNELIKKYIPPRYANMVFTLNDASLDEINSVHKLLNHVSTEASTILYKFAEKLDKQNKSDSDESNNFVINKLNEFYSGYNKSSNSIEEQLSTEKPVSKIETQELITKRNEVIKKWIPCQEFIILLLILIINNLKILKISHCKNQ